MESNSLELLHSIQLDMLVKFDKICEDNNLTYFLDSGTALGAVRHKGFIPWDDDVDVGMPREDYDKLIELGRKGLPDNLFVQTYESDPAYMMPFAKIRLGNSYFPEKGGYVDKMKYQGIYIDVFPYDKVPANAEQATRRVKKSRLLYFLSVFSRRDYPGRKLPQLVVSRFLHHLSDRKILYLHKKYDKFCTKYNVYGTSVMTCFCWRISQRNTFFFNEKELFPTEKTVFEGKELSVVHDTNTYLTKMFGDYMVLPSEEDRKSHLIGSFEYNVS